MKKSVILLISIWLTTGCNSWLDLKPEDSRVSDQYWTTAEDVQTTMLSCYSRLRNCLPYFMVWGEVRAESFDVNSLDATEDIAYIHSQDITSDNSFVTWSALYKVINSANSVIAYAPLVLERDPLFTEDEMNDYIAEAKGIRALAYYYLVRAFREVPLVLEPYVSDELGFVQAKATEQKIWDQIVEDLNAAVQAPYRYTTTNSEAWQNVCRLTKWGAATLLAEVYLWTGEYSKSKALCELVMATNMYELLEGEEWYSIFYPGRSEEAIFELYFNTSGSQTNSLYAWFNSTNNATNYYYTLNSSTRSEFSSEDVRGDKATFTGNTVWKYLGKTTVNDDGSFKLREGKERAADWILYRYADVYLIHAEACVLSANPDYAAAAQSVNKIRERAGLTGSELMDENGSYDQWGVLQEILAERKKEFIAEGKRWFDLLRIARIDGFSKYKSNVLEVMLKNVSLNERPIYQTKLAQNGRFYFPVFKDEIDMSGGVLVQNEAYE